MATIAENTLQAVALSLPAVVLYMNVLTSLYQTPDEAKAQFISPESREGGPIEYETHRGFVNYTEAEEGWDFRLSIISLIVLVAGAMSLILGMLLKYRLLDSVGVILASVGFTILIAALAYTAYSSVKMLYPP